MDTWRRQKLSLVRNQLGGNPFFRTRGFWVWPHVCTNSCSTSSCIGRLSCKPSDATQAAMLWRLAKHFENKTIGNKNSQRGFLKKVLPPKNIFRCFRVLQRVLSRHVLPFPWEKTVWEVPAHFGAASFLTSGLDTCWEYRGHPMTEAICAEKTVLHRVHLHPGALRRSAVSCQKECGGVLWRIASRTRSLVRIFRWDFLMGFFQGIFCGKTAQKIRRKKLHPQNPHNPSRNPRKNPHPKIREENLHQNIRVKNPHQKIRMKNPHPHVRAKVPTSPWVKQTPANQYQRRLWTACPTWRLICHAWRRPRQFYTYHHILVSRCWQWKNKTNPHKKSVTRLWATDNSKKLSSRVTSKRGSFWGVGRVSRVDPKDACFFRIAFHLWARCGARSVKTRDRGVQKRLELTN